MASWPSRSTGGKRRSPVPALGRLVQAGEHQVPGVAVVGHVGVLVAVEPTGREFLVDHLRHRDPGLGVLGHRHVTERPYGRGLAGA